MDSHRLGTTLRVLRIRTGRTQAEVGARAGVSRSIVSRIEQGRSDEVPMRSIRAIALALDAWVDIVVRWRGGELDRAVNASHAAMHEAVATWLASLHGWEMAPEISFSVYGERGVIDVLAWHPATSLLLVIELKTELVDISEALSTFDRKIRLAPRIAAERGWRPAAVAGWLLVAGSRTNQRRLAEHRHVLRAALPDDGRRVAAWLRAPSAPIRALSFLPISHQQSLRTPIRPTKRVRHRRSCSSRCVEAA